uniref:adenylate dimethylallyltransferase (ADP/ATP-dependent) n=1 Tax=Kalanchoe fedtschenkoi TaxID=63787 RepID=A0A7N0T779_KALFE
MRVSMSPCKPSFVSNESIGYSAMNLASLKPTWGRRDKAVVVLGATGTGKSRLAIDLATRFPAEVINSDKIQVYKGLNIVTNKVTQEECHGVPHHLLSTVEPDSDFTASDFCRSASRIADGITGRGRLPIIAGGSNSYVDALVNDHVDFWSRYDCCFIWVHVALPVLHSFVSQRVDVMIESGLVNEVRGIFDPNDTDYSKGLRRAIGVPEMDQFLRCEMSMDQGPFNRVKVLREAVDQIKRNTCDLSCRQLHKIWHLPVRNLHRLDATDAVLGKDSWERTVAAPAAKIMSKFLDDDHDQYPPIVFENARFRLAAVAGSTN